MVKKGKKKGAVAPYVVYEDFVTFSSRLRMLNINAADRRQQMINTIHNSHISTLFHSKPPTKRRLFPVAVASSQPPCISPWKREGATFETKDNPIGLRKSSATVRIRYVLISQ